MPIVPGIGLSPQCLPPGLPCTVWNDHKLMTQVLSPHHFCYPIVLTKSRIVPVRLNLPVIPVILKSAAAPITLTPPAEASTSHQGQPDGPVPVADCSPSTYRQLRNGLHGSVPQHNTEPRSPAVKNTGTHNRLQMVLFLSHETNEIVATPTEPGNPEGLQFVDVHQSQAIPRGQQLPSQHTDLTEGEHTTCVSAEQRTEGMPAICHSITRSRKHATSNSENTTGEAHNVTVIETNKPVNNSEDESMRTDVFTTTECRDSSAEDLSGRTEKASSDMKQGSNAVKGDKQNSSESYPGKAEGGHSSSSTKIKRAVSIKAGKAMAKKGPRKGGKVIVNISGTTYFMTRERWRLLHKQWYVLIQCLIK